MSSVFNVMDYGAKGDGVHDDTHAIQLAINAAYAAGGGEVYVPAGTFVVSGVNADGGCLTLRNSVTLGGDGQGMTTLKLADGSDADIDGIVRTSSRVGTYGATVKDLTIDGNQANTSGTVHGLVSGTEDNTKAQSVLLTVDGVTLTECSGSGLLAYTLTSELLVQDSLATNNGQDGFETRFLNDPDGHGYQDGVVFYDSEASGNGDDGYDIQYASRSVIYGAISHDNGGDGLVLERMSGPDANHYGGYVTYGQVYGNGGAGIVQRQLTGVVDGVVVQDNDGGGIVLEGGDGAQVLNNSLYLNGQQEVLVKGYTSADGTVHSADPAVQLVNNTIAANAGSTAAIVGQGTAASEAVVDGNVISGASQAQSGLGDVAANLRGNRLYGTDGADTLSGTAGATTLLGGAGNDTLKGGTAGDHLVGGAGADTLSGGAGADVFVFNQASDSQAGGALDRITDFQASSDRLDLTALGLSGIGNGLNGTLKLTYDATAGLTYLQSLATDGASQGFEVALKGDYRASLSSDDFIALHAGTAAADTLNETSSTDDAALSGLGGNDRLQGGSGDNRLNGGLGADTLTGGAGADVFDYSQIADSGYSATGAALDHITDFNYDEGDQIDISALGFSGVGDGYGGTLALTYSAQSNSYSLQSLEADAQGDRFALTISTSASIYVGFDYIANSIVFGPSATSTDPVHSYTGTAGNDNLYGTYTADTLFGLAGDDQIHGQLGDDVLNGGTGRDRMWGGTGADTFTYLSRADSYRGADDQILDFLPSKDVIDVSALGYTGLGDGTDGTLKVAYSEATGRTYVKDMDTDASGHRFEISLAGNLADQMDASAFRFAEAAPAATEVELLGHAATVG